MLDPNEALAMNLRGREGGANPELDTLASLRAAEGGSSRSYVLLPAGRCSLGLEGWTADSPVPGSPTGSSVSPTSGAGECLPSIGPESPSTTTYETWAFAQNQRDELRILPGVAGALAAEPGMKQQTFIFSAAASPAKTSVSPETGQGSQAHDPACSSSSPGSSTLFDPDGFSSRTYPDCSPRTAVGTSESCLERWPTSGTAWDGGFSTHVSSECRSAGGVCSSSQPSLTEILEEPQNVPARYSLSARAATGILRRSHKRGRVLPHHLHAALRAVAESTTPVDAKRTT